MSDKTFSEGCDELLALIGEGSLVGVVEVNQVYAQNQHESVWFKHPHGGQAKYLEAPLMEHFNDYMQEIADRLLEEGPVEAMKDVVEHLSDQVEITAPVELSNLRRSGNPRVVDNGATVYNRPAKQRRLTNDELKILGRKKH